MPEIYLVRYNEAARKFFEGVPDIDYSAAWSFEVNYKWHEIIETKTVPYRFYFMSSYAGISDYEVKINGDWMRFSFMHQKEQYAWADGTPRFNYPDAETFEREYNGRFNHVWMRGRLPLPDDLFEIFRLMHPEAINGLSNPNQTKGVNEPC